MRSLSPHLAIFRPRVLSRSSVTLGTVVPPPPAVLDPGPEHAAASTPVCPLPQAVDTIALPPSTMTLPLSERAAAVYLDSTSLRARHHRALPQALDTASDEGATPPQPH
jgi:hypothetical protein